MNSRSRAGIIYTYMIGFLGLLLMGAGVVNATTGPLGDWGWRVDSTTTATIDAHGVCRQYKAPSGKNVFVPAKTAAEYLSFRSSTIISPDITACTYTWSPGTYDTCTLSCGAENQTRTVQCKRHDGAIVADSYCTATKPALTQSCNHAACPVPVNGGWSAWSGLSACNASCGGGTQSQYRVCNNPAPANGGASCGGDTTQSQSCNVQSCILGYPGCDTTDIALSNGQVWAACNVGATSPTLYGNFYQGGRNDTGWTNSWYNGWNWGVGGQGQCATNYHVPTAIEWESAYNNLGTNLPIILKLPKAGMRRYSDGYVGGQGTAGVYWSSTVQGNLGCPLEFDVTNVYPAATVPSGALGIYPGCVSYASTGMSVRCIKN